MRAEHQRRGRWRSWGRFGPAGLVTAAMMLAGCGTEETTPLPTYAAPMGTQPAERSAPTEPDPSANAVTVTANRTAEPLALDATGETIDGVDADASPAADDSLAAGVAAPVSAERRIAAPTIPTPVINLPTMKRTYLNFYDDDINAVIRQQERALQRSVDQFGREVNTAMQQFAEPIDRKLAQADDAITQLNAVTADQRKQAEAFRQDMIAQAATLDAQHADLLAQQEEARQLRDEMLAQQKQMSAQQEQMQVMSTSLDRQIAEADHARERLENARGWAVWLIGIAGTCAVLFVLTPVLLRIVRAWTIRRFSPKPRPAIV